LSGLLRRINKSNKYLGYVFRSSCLGYIFLLESIVNYLDVGEIRHITRASHLDRYAERTITLSNVSAKITVGCRQKLQSTDKSEIRDTMYQ
jgi:hypothetical protein